VAPIPSLDSQLPFPRSNLSILHPTRPEQVLFAPLFVRTACSVLYGSLWLAPTPADPTWRGTRREHDMSGPAPAAEEGDAARAQVDLWEARRRAWLTPPASVGATSSAPAVPPRPRQHPGRRRLEELLSVDGAEEDASVWSQISAVASRLARGSSLNAPLPLGIVVKLLRGTWIREGLWPTNADGTVAVAAESENGHGVEEGPSASSGPLEEEATGYLSEGTVRGEGNTLQLGHGD